jgi:gamma-glutamylaminecyclotransferase
VTDADDGATLFVYGTLTDPERVADVVDDFSFRGPAVLRGLAPVQGRYPTLAPGERTTGRLLWVRDVDAVDDYEGVDRGLYVRVAVPRADGDDVWTYVGDPARLDVADAVDWPGDGPLAERVRACVRDREVRVDPVE